MFSVIKNSWALLFGMMLLMLGNGLQGTLLGIRGAIEGMSPQTMSWVMTGYFVGFLGGSTMTPKLIRRVGHVRVFAALASLVSACLILFAAWPNEFFWFFLRLVVGFCFSGIYVVAESWLNDAATNENRGQTLSIYVVVQMLGIVLAQALLNFADPSGYTLFILISVVVSLSFAPILLSVSPAPAFQTSKRMSFAHLWKVSPLGVVGHFLIGAVFSAMFGMASVFGTERGLSVGDISLFVAAIYIGGIVLQFPIGWLSDRMDRRLLIILICAVGAMFTLSIGVSNHFFWLLAVAFVTGGVSNPLYSLFIAYTNDFLDHDDMASASGGLIFITGLGSISGPTIVGWMLTNLGANSFFWFIGANMILMGGYATYRISQRASVPIEETSAYAPVLPTASPVAVEVAQEYAIEMALEEEAALELQDQEIASVLDYWFEEVDQKDWFVQSDAVDAQIIERFAGLHKRAANAELSTWADTADGSLALLILLDQFSRNMYRGDAKSFATDALARDIANAAIRDDHDLLCAKNAQNFYYLPFMHSEDLDDQDRGIALTLERAKPMDNALHARAHRAIIAKFGRFPFRNAAMGRETTPEEQQFLDEGGYGQIVKQVQSETAG